MLKTHLLLLLLRTSIWSCICFKTETVYVQYWLVPQQEYLCSQSGYHSLLSITFMLFILKHDLHWNAWNNWCWCVTWLYWSAYSEAQQSFEAREVYHVDADIQGYVKPTRVECKWVHWTAASSWVVNLKRDETNMWYHDCRDNMRHCDEPV